MPAEFLILGLMAGTSVDGIDAAIITTDGESIARTGFALTTAYEKATREAIFRAFEDPFNIEDDLAERIARDHARAAEMLIAKSGMMPDLIGFHGQTIYHAPEDGVSLQIGDGEYLADRLGVPVVCQFRQNDLAHGGQGAPLAPIYHQALIKTLGLNLPAALVNIGGISNASILEDSRLVGLDLGPGNALMDDLAMKALGQPFDEGGMMAASGHVDEGLVKACLSHDFFKKKGPKSLDRKGLYELIPHEALNVLSPEDHMATLAAITGKTIAEGIKLNAPNTKEIVICGGGSFNPVVMTMIKKYGGEIKVSRMEDFMMDGIGLDSRFIEAELMAYLAARSVLDLPITFPETTGVDESRSGGVKLRAKFK